MPRKRSNTNRRSRSRSRRQRKSSKRFRGERKRPRVVVFVDRSESTEEEVKADAREGRLRDGTLVLTSSAEYPSRPEYFVWAVVNKQLVNVGEEFYLACMDLDQEPVLREALDKHFAGTDYEKALNDAFFALGY